jgi:hypothetical protein
MDKEYRDAYTRPSPDESCTMVIQNPYSSSAVFVGVFSIHKIGPHLECSSNVFSETIYFFSSSIWGHPLTNLEHVN